jgi:DAPG hydrolase PhiG domain
MKDFFYLKLNIFVKQYYLKSLKTKMMQPKYVGYRPEDRETPYAKYYSETIAPLSMPVEKALAESPFRAGSLPPLSKITDLCAVGYADLEEGFSFETDGSIHVAALTPMPNVSPKMWDWWFGWHGSLDNRYKLWHPKAHLSAAWQDGDGDTGQYIGRTSMIEEFIGNKLEKANIQFISPTELGFPQSVLQDKDKVVFICARIGDTQLPIDFGWLVHQVRATTDGTSRDSREGAEMRSRFFLGGPHIQIRLRGWLPKQLSKLLQKVVRLPKKQARDLLMHCAEEMNHLAAFLPQIYAENKP